jgi:hypothetical protein
MIGMPVNVLRSLKILFLVVGISLASERSVAGDNPYCLGTDHRCDRSNKNEPPPTDGPGYPATSEDSLLGFTLDPSAVPVREAIGLAAIYYKIRPQYVFVRGTGRIGAAISPSNADDTFFGNPAAETDQDYLYRRQESLPFNQLKVALGVAASLFDNEEKGFSRFQMTLGALGRYIGESNAVKPGGGATIALGPLTIGGAYSLDQTLVGTREGQDAKRVESVTTSLTAGLTLGSLMLDYTRLTAKREAGDETHVELASLNLLLRRFVISGAYRIENSSRGGFDATTRALYSKPVKESVFGGVQFSPLSFLQIGAFYNYFLLEEVSAGVTLFF